MNNIVYYRFSGVASVTCDSCNLCQEIKFSGTDESIEDAIENALERAGWSSGTCPECTNDLGIERED